MIKLLNAGLLRLRKSKLFLSLAIFSIGLALFMIYTQYSDMKKYGVTIEAEQLLLNYATGIGTVIAIFTSLFLGAEYSDGAIRNKISVGHKRIHIYLSNLFITTITSLFSYILFIAIVCLIGIPLFGRITIPFSKLLMLLGCIFVTIIAYSGIFTFIAMVISNKAITAIVSIMLGFGFIMAALICLNIIEAQPLIEAASITNEDTGDFEIVQEPNPRYPSEAKRKMCQTLLDINPAGQMFQLAGRAAPNLAVLPIYSLGLLIVFTTAGIVVFQKKQLK